MHYKTSLVRLKRNCLAFDKKVFESIRKGKGLIVHDGISKIAKRISKAVRDEGNNKSGAIVIAHVDSAKAGQATRIVNRYRTQKQWASILYDSTKLESGKQTLFGFCSLFIFTDPKVDSPLPRIPYLTNERNEQVPTFGLLLQGDWADVHLLEEAYEAKRPTIVVGDSNGLAELIRYFILEDPEMSKQCFKTDQERLDYYINPENRSRIVADYDLTDLEHVDDAEVSRVLNKIDEMFKKKYLFVWNAEVDDFDEFFSRTCYDFAMENVDAKFSWISILKLSLLLENNDIATKIYQNEEIYPEDQEKLVAEMFMDALLAGNANLVRLLNDFHFEFSSFLTVERNRFF